MASLKDEAFKGREQKTFPCISGWIPTCTCAGQELMRNSREITVTGNLLKEQFTKIKKGGVHTCCSGEVSLTIGAFKIYHKTATNYACDKVNPTISRTNQKSLWNSFSICLQWIKLKKINITACQNPTTYKETQQISAANNGKLTICGI